MLFMATAIGMIAVAQSPKPAAGDSPLIGDWRGDSICVVRPSACNDEKALYHFKKLGDQPNRFSLQADKVVNGKAEDMGATMECSFVPDKHALTCSTPRLVLHLTLNANRLDGTMNLPDGTVWRNINLKKAGS
jgi:hypothetical protein